jgi:hypothetical protein
LSLFHRVPEIHQNRSDQPVGSNTDSPDSVVRACDTAGYPQQIRRIRRVHLLRLNLARRLLFRREDDLILRRFGFGLGCRSLTGGRGRPSAARRDEHGRHDQQR